MKSFWTALPKPFIILAPMEGVTDVVFREIVSEIGKSDVFFTEFVNCDGIASTGREKVAEGFKFTKNQLPVVAQIWGTNPKTFFTTAQYAKKLGFSGIDINMGCPVKPVIRHGACAALIKNQRLAKEIIDATKKGAGGLSVSVKTRIGFSNIQIEEWLGFLLQQDLAALSVHLRTAAELSQVPAHWELMPQIMSLRNKIAPQTLIVGNGDIVTLNEVYEKHKQYRCDGFMIGRGIFHNPWMFNKNILLEDVTVQVRIKLYMRHIELFKKTWGTKRNFANLKKFCKTYIQNFDGASTLREKLMETRNIEELKSILINISEDL